MIERGIKMAILTAQERNSVMTIHKEKTDFKRLSPTNQRLAGQFLLYISINNYTYHSCLAMKSTMFKFFYWNLHNNENETFYGMKKIHFRRFFMAMFAEGFTYDRVRIMKSHLSTLSDFCEHILGHEKFTYKLNENKWYKFKNIVIDVDLPQTQEKIVECNKHTFKQEDLDRLDWYLRETKNWQGLVVLHFANLGIDILDLTVDTVLNYGDKYCTKWVRYLERYGLPFKNAIVVQHERNVWKPATKEDIKKFEEFFTAFLGRNFIICNY